jgi:hypothetical protein
MVTSFEISGRDPHGLFEEFAEIILVVKADLVGYLLHSHFGGQKKHFCLLYAQAVAVAYNTHTYLLLELSVSMIEGDGKNTLYIR